MDDRERVEALAADGRITREEADRLLTVLDDIDQTERELAGVDQAVQGEAAPAEGTRGEAAQTSDGAVPTVDPSPDARPGGRPGPGPGPSAATGDPKEAHPAARARRPEGSSLRWVDVQLLAGDLDIEVDDEISTPQVTSSGPGETELEPTERGYRLKGSLGNESKEGSILERLLGNVTRGNISLTLPEGWGVRLDMKAGDVEIRGPLAFLAGNLLAGDLDADELHGVDLSVKAGDIDLSLRLDEGSHSVRAVAGDLNVKLLEGCDVRAHGRVNIGDLSLEQGWERTRRGLGWAFQHSLGEGRGVLELELGTGDLGVSRG